MGNPKIAVGWRVYGVAVMVVATVCLVWGGFDPGQPVPKDFPLRMALGYVAAALMLVAGAAVVWRRTAAWGGALLAGYFGLIVVVLMYGRVMLKHYAEYGTYESLAEQLAVAAAGLIVYASFGKMDSGRAERLTLVGRLLFGVCALIWGGAHFVYMNLTAPLVPKWLPPGQVFWGYATGVGFILAGVAFLTGVKARLAAVLLTGMIACFTVLVHVRMLLADRHSHFNWSELGANLAVLGAAWVVADSLAGCAPHRKVESEMG